jgi:F0F1-type ATP synthase membrane subunit a
MMVMGLFVGIVQTLVFILLSMAYFSLAIEGHE